MKKWIALLAAMLLLFSAACAEDVTGEQTPITVGVTTQMSGCFYSDMWGVNTVDADIRDLLHGYGTVVWKNGGEYGINENVAVGFEATDDNVGRTYLVTLAGDLTYNDGTPITAVDYVFTILLQSDPSIPQLEGMNTNFSHVVGYDGYASGATNVFSGVRLLSDSQFSITVPANALPYFYELTYAAVQPCPIHVIAPGYHVADDGKGAYLAGPDGEPSALTAELLADTLTSESGYLHQPRVTCGPYQLESYNAAESTASLIINPSYKGNYEGRKPEIERITVRQLASGDALAAYQNGEVQVLHKLSDGATIDAALQLAATGAASVTNYLRSGYAFLAYACEHAPTDNVDIRQAVAMCIDRGALVEEVLHGYGLAVNGYYGFGQWMAAQHMSEMVQFDIGYNLDAARALLERAGYRYNEQGKAYVAGEGLIRYKVEDGVLSPLELKWAKVSSVSADALQRQLETAFATLGIRLIINEMSFADMLNEYYRLDGARSNDLYFLADNFFHVFDPYYTYNTGDKWQGVFNTSGLRDKTLMDAAEAMRRVSGADIDTYYAQWLTFQRLWHELMPTAPIYSNVYYDVYPPTWYEYAANAQYGFSSALLYASFQPPAEAQPEETAGGDVFETDDAGDDEMIIED